MNWDPNDPLARVPNETQKANAALRDYALIGPGRSLRRLIAQYRSWPKDDPRRPPTRQITILKGWSSKWAWQERIARFDELQYEAELETWEERRRELYEQDWQTGRELREKVLIFLKELPRFLRTSEAQTTDPVTGEKIQVITIALNTTLSQIATALRQASDLQRLATDEPTAHIQLSGAALDAAIEHELALLADAGQATISGPAEGEKVGKAG